MEVKAFRIFISPTLALELRADQVVNRVIGTETVTYFMKENREVAAFKYFVGWVEMEPPKKDAADVLHLVPTLQPADSPTPAA